MRWNMNNLKTYGLRLIYTIISLLLSLILLTTLYYFNLISPTTYKVLKITIFLINIFISAYILGKKAKTKGYLEGIKLSSIIIPLLFILTVLTNSPLKLRIIIYYLIIIFTALLGSMIGINRKKELSN